MSEAEFVSVGQAAKLLAVSDRTARRMAGQLADSDRTEGTGHGRRVRLAAMQALRSEALQQRGKGDSSFHVETASKPKPGHGHPVNGRSMAGQDTNAVAELAALRAEKEGLLARLADTASDRDAWKEQAARLDTRLAEALEALQRAQDEARASRLIGQWSVPMLSPLETADGSQSSPDVPGGTIPRRSSEASAPDTTKRPFWAFWRKG